jgi:predicted glutamine amidotransferase
MTFKEFENCFNSNRDGVGFGFNKKGKQFYVKGFMDIKSAWNFYKGIPNISHVVHFRLGTSGENIPELTHPFIASELSPLPLRYIGDAPLIFHNGIIFDWKLKAQKYLIPIVKNDPLMSDTRLLSILVGKFGLEYFDRFVDNYDGKFIIMNNNKATMKGKFIHEDGVYFSNDKFKDSYYTTFADIERMYKKDKTKKEILSIQHDVEEEYEDDIDSYLDSYFEDEFYRKENLKKIKKFEFRNAWK